MQTKVYLADLTHTATGIMSLSFPLGVAYVAAYARQELGEEFDFRLFKFPEDLGAAIAESPPRVLAMSNYSWNLELAYKLSAWAKERDPGLTVIFGGPNFPVVADEKTDFLRRRSAIDVYISNEGEIAFAALLEKLAEHDFDIAALKRSRVALPNACYLDGDDLIEGPSERIRDVNSIPSPYLMGLMDEFFDHPLTPMIETTRGCPFGCTFCADGLKIKSKITSFHLDRVRDELEYMSARVTKTAELNVTDLNFGMYSRDTETAEMIAEQQERAGWPLLVKASAGKNLPHRVIATASLLKGAWVIGSAIQSSDANVLKNIQRSNIKVEAYQEFLELMNNLEQNASTFSEIILALPGDSKATHFQSLRHAVDSGVNFVKQYQAMLLLGTDMASRAHREKFGLRGLFRIMAGGVGTYHFGEDAVRVAEIQEIVVGGNEMTFDEYVSCRRMSLILEAFYNNAPFGEFFAALQAMGVPAFDVLLYLHEHEELYTPRIREIMDRFIEGTTSNLYETHDEAEARGLSDEMFDAYVSGELGFNEVLECKAMMYFEMEETLALLLAALDIYLEERGLMTDGVKQYFAQLSDFTMCRKSAFNETEKVFERSYNYDFEAIGAAKYEVDPRSLATVDGGMDFTFFHVPEQKSEIAKAVSQYENHPGGMSRLLYVQNMKKLYRTVARA